MGRGGWQRPSRPSRPTQSPPSRPSQTIKELVEWREQTRDYRKVRAIQRVIDKKVAELRIDDWGEGDRRAMTDEEIIKPDYYKGHSGRDVIDVACDFGSDALRFSAFKYIVRAGRKSPDTFGQDIDKAIECLQRLKAETGCK